MSKVLLSVVDLHQHFTISSRKKVYAVNGVSFNIYEGETLGIVGESGSGKSTLAQSILGLHNRSRGEVIFEDTPLPKRLNAKGFRQNAKLMQMIFQDPYSSLNPRMTIFDLIAEPLILQGDRKKESIVEEVRFWLEKVDLPHSCQSHYPHQLSGGQCQRVGIARALIADPKLIICDEPLSALDVSIQAQVLNMLLDLKKEKYSFIFIAHDLSTVAYIADRVAVMYLGKIVEIGTNSEIFDTPGHPYTKSLLAANLLPQVRKEKPKRQEIKIIDIPSPINLPKGCSFVSRCSLVSNRCLEEIPRLDASSSHQIACFNIAD